MLPAVTAAADDRPCGAHTVRNSGGAITTQNCPIYLPRAMGYVPVHALAPGARPVGRLVAGGDVNWFLCQASGPLYQEGPYHNVWWALTLSDDGRRGWVSEVHFSGGGNDEPDAALRVCGEADFQWAHAGGAGGPGGAAPVPMPAPAPTAPPAAYSMLQVNLCNSGTQPCHDAFAVPRAAELITARRPSVVTANEICASDLQPLRIATGYAGVFTQSGEQRCANGRAYGNALLFPRGIARGPADSVTYEPQDSKIELRTLTCVRAQGVTACVTHLSPRASGPAQAEQMRNALAAHARRGPTTLGGDLNLAYPEVQRYVPAGMFRKGDGDVQHVIASGHFGYTGRRIMALDWTDHPALQVYLKGR